MAAEMPSPSRLFQFTHPGKGATFDDKAVDLEEVVSIHAPWEGCDLVRALHQAQDTPFQFTHPGKGATLHQL